MQIARVVTPRKSKQKSIVSTVAKETPRATLTLLTLLPTLTGLCVKLEWASRNLSCVPSFCEVLHQALAWWRSHMKGQRFSLLPMPFMMVFTVALARISPMFPSCILTRDVARLVGGSVCSVTAGLPLRTGAHGPVTLDNATVPVAELLAVTFFGSKGLLDPSTSTPIASMCALAKTSLHNARNEAHTSLFGPDCSKPCQGIREMLRSLGAKPTSPRTTSTSWI